MEGAREGRARVEERRCDSTHHVLFRDGGDYLSPLVWRRVPRGAERACSFFSGHASLCREEIYAEVNLVTALVPSETACLASSPGRMRCTAVWISREVTVGFLL